MVGQHGLLIALQEVVEIPLCLMLQSPLNNYKSVNMGNAVYKHEYSWMTYKTFVKVMHNHIGWSLIELYSLSIYPLNQGPLII